MASSEREHGGVRTMAARGGGQGGGGGDGGCGGGDGDHVEEFTVPTSAQSLINNLTQKLQQIFSVCMTLVTTQADNFSWVKLTGKCQENVQRAKEFVVGLCGEGLQKKQHFPPGLQCVFEGLGGRFLHALTWDSCADVSVAREGCLIIRGGTEAVLLAQTRVQHFCDCCHETDAAAGAGAAASSAGEADPLGKRRFNRLVEENGGKYGTEFLLLPLSIKRELLELLDAMGAYGGGATGTSPVPPDRPPRSFVLSPRGAISTEAPGGDGGRIRVTMPTEAERTRGKGGDGPSREENGSPMTELSSSFTSALGKNVAEISEVEEVEESVGTHFHGFKKPSVKRKTSDSEAPICGQMKKHSHTNNASSHRLGEEGFRDCDRVAATAASQVTPEPERELKYLMNFFSTMGYAPELVRSVVSEIGQKTEPSEILDRLQEKASLVAVAGGDEDKQNGGEEAGTEAPSVDSYAMHCVMEAAMSLGYSRDEVGDVCRAVGADPRSVLSELHRMGGQAPASPTTRATQQKRWHELQNSTGALAHVVSQGTCANRDAARAVAEKEDPESSRPRSRGREEDARDGPANGVAVLRRRGGTVPLAAQRARLPSTEEDDLQTDGTGAPPPTGRYPKDQDCIVLSDDDSFIFGSTDSAAQEEVTKWPSLDQKYAASASGSRAGCLLSAVASATTTTTTPAATTHSKNNLQPTELFLLALRKPYKLCLPNEPGKDSVRHVIVDGSNVAMAHGMNRFFSCRGIALCVEYFWRRGHRNITVFVPQFRTCRNPDIKEQYLLTQLEELGLLSFTPCRVFEGRRITTHDDRFMLHLAENTDGIIVTNDNLREFPKESVAWRDIIKRRILPYTFAGGIFMVPDDPLGRYGPSLEKFLAKPLSARLPQHNPAAYKAHTLGHGPLTVRAPIGSAAAAATVTGLVGSRSMSERSQLPWPRSMEQKRSVGDLRSQLLDIFPGEEEKVRRVMEQHPAVLDLNQLSDFMLDV